MAIHYCLRVEDEELTRKLPPGDVATFGNELRARIGTQEFERIARLPSFAWGRPAEPRTHVLAQLAFSDHEKAKSFHDSLGGKLGKCKFGSDPPIADMDVWSPLGPGGGLFADRALADSLTGVSALAGATGRGVNVVIVDRGLDQDWVEATARRMGARHHPPVEPAQGGVSGWARLEWSGKHIKRYIYPGATGSEHARMIARNVLAIAPAARIWDAPLLPSEDEPDAPPNVSLATALFDRINTDIRRGKMTTWDARTRREVEVSLEGRWVIVNAWGVFDPEAEASFLRYADDPDNPLLREMPTLDSGKNGIDVIFAAGNCGEPCPDRRCGRDDCGPGRSISGLNAHPNVLTVGAVRADGLPIAFSAQGPGRLAKQGSEGIFDYTRNRRAIRKPDICAPSHFRESDDADEMSTGTSGACGYAAGVVAALRSTPEGSDVEPAEMREILRLTARRGTAAGHNWDPRLGYGIINASAALAELK